MSDVQELKGMIIPAFNLKELIKKGIPEHEVNIFKNYKLFPRQILVKRNGEIIDVSFFDQENADGE